MHRYDDMHPNTDPMQPATNGNAMPRTVRLIALPLAVVLAGAAIATSSAPSAREEKDDSDSDDDDSNAYINDIGNAIFQHASYRQCSIGTTDHDERRVVVVVVVIRDTLDRNAATNSDATRPAPPPNIDSNLYPDIAESNIVVPAGNASRDHDDAMPPPWPAIIVDERPFDENADRGRR
jgi:hypothetical protein